MFLAEAPRAPPGAQPRRRARRGDARRPRDGRRDLPHRALAEGHERDDGLRRAWRRSRTRWRTSSSCCASARGGLDREAIDVLLECLDALEARGRVDRRPRRGAPRPASRSSSACSGLVRDPRPSRRRRASGGASAAAEILAARRRRAASCTSPSRFADDVQMPAVRAFMVLGALERPRRADRLRARPRGARRLRRPQRRGLARHRRAAEDVARRGRARVPRRRRRALAELVGAAEDEPAAHGRRTAAGAAAAAAGRRPAAARPQHRPRRRRAPRPAHAPHGRARRAPHARRVARRRGRRARASRTAMQDLTRASQALQAMVMQVRMIPVEAVFLRFPRLVRDLSSQARQAGRARARRQGHRARPHRRRRARRPDRPPRPQLARPRPRAAEERVAAGKPADRHARDLRPPRRRQRRHHRPRRRPRHRPGAGSPRKAVERGLIAAEAAAPIDAARAAELLFAPGFSTAEVDERHLRPRRRHGRRAHDRSASSAARSLLDLRARARARPRRSACR